MNNIIIEINENETEAQRLGRMIKYLRLSTGMKREDFANYFHILLGTVRDWEQGKTDVFGVEKEAGKVECSIAKRNNRQKCRILQFCRLFSCAISNMNTYCNYKKCRILQKW